MTAIPPNGWGVDSLSDFFERAYQNAWATFANYSEWFKLLGSVNNAFQLVAENLSQPTVAAPVVLLPRSHSAFLASARLATSGQPPEAYMVARVCLEFALHGAFIRDIEARSRQWLKLPLEPGEGTTFTIKNMMSDIDAHRPSIAKDMRYLYGLCINQGAHPNTDSVIWNMRTERTEEVTTMTFQYLKATGPSFDICMKTVVQVGIVALQLFETVFSEIFGELGVTSEITRLATRELQLSQSLTYSP